MEELGVGGKKKSMSGDLSLRVIYICFHKDGCNIKLSSLLKLSECGQRPSPRDD